MGAITWRAQEFVFLEAELAKPDVKALFKRARTRREDLPEGHKTQWFVNVVNYLTKAYLDKFQNVRFAAETDIEFALRKGRQRYGHPTPYGEETVEEQASRLAKIKEVSIGCPRMCVSASW